MKFGMVNKSTTMNRFVLHTLQRNITHLAVITRKTNIKLGILKGGGETGKEPIVQSGDPLGRQGFESLRKKRHPSQCPLTNSLVIQI